MTDQTLVTLFNGGVVAGFCGDNPNIPRVFVTQFGGMSLQGSGECNGSLPVTLKPTTEEVMTTPDSFVIGAVNPLEPAVRDSIMENENFRSILVQVSAGIARI